MILKDIKTGDAGLIRSSFNIKNIDTWLSGIVRFGINFWNNIKGNPTCPANHNGIFVVEGDKIWFYEAVSKGYVKVDAVQKFSSKSIDDVWVLRPQYEFDEEVVKTISEKLVGVRYNFIGLASQFYRQLFDERVMVESREIESIHKRVYCSQAYAATMYLASGKRMSLYWPSADPEDIYFDPNMKIINQK